MLRAVIICFCILKITAAINVVIWNNDKQDFLPTDNISTYQMDRLYILNRSRELEIYNFQNQSLTFGFYYVRKNKIILKISWRKFL